MRKLRLNPFPEIVRFENIGWIDGKRLIRLTKPLIRITSEGTDIIDEGFISDGGSIPPPAWPIMGHPFGEFLEDVIGHDWDYRLDSVRSRWRADYLLKETMWNRGFHLWKIASFYAAVRTGGVNHYKGKGLNN